MINTTLVTNAQIEAVAEEFSAGYWACTNNDTSSILLLGIGTNNSYSDVSSAGGGTWAHLVSDVRSYNHAHGYDTQVSAGGANDMEPGFNTKSATEAWANGYVATTNAYYIDYGPSDGCPQNTSTNGSCNNGWTQYDEWYLSWGIGTALALPEIYYQSQANQWAMISQYGANHQYQGTIFFEGPLDENPLKSTTFTAQQAWDQFTSALNIAGVQSGMSYSAEISNET